MENEKGNFFIFIGICLLTSKIIFAHDKNIVHSFTLTEKVQSFYNEDRWNKKCPMEEMTIQNLPTMNFHFFTTRWMPPEYKVSDDDIIITKLTKEGTIAQ